MASPSCCPEGSWPALKAPDDYTPQGVEEMIDDLPIYVVGTPGEKAILVTPEIFGWAGRLKGICDSLAAEGYFVVMLDCHRKDTADGKDDMLAWIAATPFEVVSADYERVLNYVSEKGATSVGAMGFCWGVWAFCKASASGLPLKCGVGPHPSTKLETYAFGGDETAMMAAVSMPVFLMPCANDPDTLKEGGEVATAIMASGGQVHHYSDMQHGFFSRGDLSDPNVKRDVEDGMRKTLDFFAAHL